MKRMLIPGLLLLVLACDSDHGHEDEHAHDEEGEEGEPSGAVCPPESTLTYENFGQSFVTSYCTHCHSSELTGADRMGAPLEHDFDTLAGILAVAGHVDEYAAAGPDSTNEAMPPSDPKPTLAERQMLGEWLACETQ
jgi:uncharacterized membrane protein